MELEGYIIEMEVLIRSKKLHAGWDKWNRKVYKDLDTAKHAIKNIPDCYKNFDNWWNVKARIVPVYRGEVECEIIFENKPLGS